VKRSTERILTTHIGSLPRPLQLRQLVVDRIEGKPVDDALLATTLTQAVADVVHKQVEVGLDVVNDGEQSKNHHAGYLRARLSGIEVTDRAPARRTFSVEADDFPEYYARGSTAANERLRAAARSACCVGPLGWKDFCEVKRDIANLKVAIGQESVADVFMTSPSPTIAANFQPNIYYPDDETYLYAMADVLKREYRAITDAGFVLQVDCIGFGTATRSRAASLQEGRREVARNIEVLNHALADVPAEQVRMHMCWGSDPGPHTRDGELRDMVDLLVGAKPMGITVVGASGRHVHEWKVWRDVKLPDDKVIIAGVIDHSTNIVEHPETVADRIVRYAQVVGRERVIAGVDCGFAPAAGLEDLRVEPRVMWTKFQSLVAGAALASRELWA
jgi:5-methyltetrahydropteroyltriglutamate--homocysteine methyltransferase